MVAGRKLYIKLNALAAEAQSAHRANEFEHFDIVRVLHTELFKDLGSALVQHLEGLFAQLLHLGHCQMVVVRIGHHQTEGVLVRHVAHQIKVVVERVIHRAVGELAGLGEIHALRK